MANDQFFKRVLGAVRAKLAESSTVAIDARSPVYEGRSGGPYARLGLTKRSNLGVELWFDQYIDRVGGRRRLSSWLVATPKRRGDLDAVRDRSRGWVHEASTIGRVDRTERWYVRPDLAARLPGIALRDVWPNANFLGRYLARIENGVERAANLLVADIEEMAAVAERVCPEPPPFPAADKTTLALVKRRAGQTRFRENLRRWFGGRCVVSGSNAWAVLEAAHIMPHSKLTDYRIENGLLLRADLHTLFDLGLIWIEPARRPVLRIADELRGTEYEVYADKPIACPGDRLTRDHRRALRRRVTGA